jgi:hypothetical protein
MDINTELAKCFEIDPNINEVDIIDPLVLHFYSDQGKYDYLSDKLILMENKLGISSSCVTEIHKSNRDLMKKFRKFYNHDDPKETLISAYKKEPKSIIF